MTEGAQTVELEERLRRLEAASRPPNADELAEQVMTVLAEKARSRGAMPEGLLPAVQYIPTRPDAPPGAIHSPDDGERHWLFYGLGTELRFIPRMYFDPRYRLSRVAQLGVPIALALVIVNYVFFNFPPMAMVPLLPAVLERLVLLFLGVLVYKVLSREVTRYRQVMDYLARYG